MKARGTEWVKRESGNYTIYSRERGGRGGREGERGERETDRQTDRQAGRQQAD